MLETMLQSGKKFVPPVQGEGTIIFQLHGFDTVSDIVDRGPLVIPVNRGSNITVGKNDHGTFINFPGIDFNSFINFANPKLDCMEAEINIKINDILETGGMYGAGIMDARPVRTNGNYVITSIVTTGGPRKSALYTNGDDKNGNILHPANEMLNIKIKLYKDKSLLYINDVLEITNGPMANGVKGQNYGLGQHAFAGVFGVMPLSAKVYYFDIRKIS